MAPESDLGSERAFPQKTEGLRKAAGAYSIFLFWSRKQHHRIFPAIVIRFPPRVPSYLLLCNVPTGRVTNKVRGRSDDLS
jgi:hypothetical protein